MLSSFLTLCAAVTNAASSVLRRRGHHERVRGDVHGLQGLLAAGPASREGAMSMQRPRSAPGPCQRPRARGGPRRSAADRNLVRRVDLERAAWTDGHDADSQGLFQQAEDMTILGPWGGPGAGGSAQIAERQTRIAGRFHDGSGYFELMETYVEGDLAVVVGIERSRVRFAGAEEFLPWELRSTQVFRKVTDEQWVRLHRHADPLLRSRSLTETVRLLCPRDSGPS